MEPEFKRCPLCAEQILLNATSCPFCGAQFSVVSKGYCPQCHAVREADDQQHCKICGTAVIDHHYESKFLGKAQSPSKPTPITPSMQPIAEPEKFIIMPIKGESVLWRFDSLFVDMVIISFLYSVLVVIILLFRGSLQNLLTSNFKNLDQVLGSTVLLILPILWFVYFFIFEGALGTTPGKAIHGLKVIRQEGGKINWGQAAVRAIFSFLEYNLIGAILIWSTPLRQRLGDLVARTLVVNANKVSYLEVNPPQISIEFHDYHKLAFSKILEGTIKYFGMIKILKLNGLTTNQEPKKIKIRGYYFRSEFGVLVHNIENKLGLTFKKRIIIWRLIFLIVTLMLIVFGIIILLGGLLNLNVPSIFEQKSVVTQQEPVASSNITLSTPTLHPTNT